MKNPTTVDQCNELIAQCKEQINTAEESYLFSMASGNMDEVKTSKQIISLYRKRVGSLVKTKLALLK
tara:strand:- start:3216 stop:3416 length:201 start_codon:yes stop_codon:yes gene_type:complete